MHLDTFQIYTSSNLNFPKDGPFHVLFSIKISLYIYKVTSKVTIVLLLMVLKTYIFISKIAHNIDISPGVANKLPLEESNVDDRRVEIDKLEDEYFEGEIIIKIRLSSVHF